MAPTKKDSQALGKGPDIEFLVLALGGGLIIAILISLTVVILHSMFM